MTKTINYEITVDELSDDDRKITLTSRELDFSLWVIFHDPDVPYKHSRLPFSYRLFAKVGVKTEEKVQSEVIYAAGDTPIFKRLFPWQRDGKTPHQKVEYHLREYFQFVGNYYLYLTKPQTAALKGEILAFVKKVKEEHESRSGLDPDSETSDLLRRDPARKVFA